MYREMYNNASYCYQELAVARKIFTNPNSTDEQYEAMEKALGLMYIYCPEDVQYMVMSSLNESNLRQHYRRFKPTLQGKIKEVYTDGF